MQPTASSFAWITRQMQWLAAQAANIRQLQARPSVGVFGTTYAATWVYAELAGKAAFFVDEDPYKVGRKHLGKPVIAPREVPPGSDVFMPFPRRLAEAIVSRIANPLINWHLPTELSLLENL
jgi:hypothetical protein